MTKPTYNRARVMRDARQRGDIGNPEDGICGRLGVDEPGVGPHRRSDLRRIARVDQADFDAPSRQMQAE